MSGDVIQALYPTATVAGAATEPANVDLPVPSASAKTMDKVSQLREQAGRRLLDARWGEPPASSVLDYSSLFPGGVVAEHERGGLAAALKLGVGITQLAAVVKLARASAKPGYEPPTDEEAVKALYAAWGTETDTNIAKARALCDRVTKEWPNFKWFLEVTRLGSTPAMIHLLYRKAVELEKRAGR